VVARHHHNFRLRQRGTQPRELEVGVQDGGVGRTHLVEHVTRDQHDVRRELDHLVQRARERLRDVRFALVDAARSQPLILAVAKVEVGEVDEAQSERGESALTGCPRES
jgi:hypothetical protein